jgi:hypothetical protein
MARSREWQNAAGRELCVRDIYRVRERERERKKVRERERKREREKKSYP